MSTLGDIETMVARDLRDSSNNTWSTSELDDLINQGIDALADFYPKEIVSTFATIASGTFSYGTSSAGFNHVYRIDVYSSAGSYQMTLPAAYGDGPDSGWELHASTIWLPPDFPLDTGSTLQGFGYGRYVQLSASSSTTDLDSPGLWAVRVFCQAEGFGRLVADRAAFAQWQSDPGNTDVTALALNQIAFSWRRRWAEEQRRLRRMRKMG